MAALRAVADLFQICRRRGDCLRGDVCDQVLAQQNDRLSQPRPDAICHPLLPADKRPNIEWRGVPFITGVLTTVIQVLAGVGELFLDIFFQKSMLDRKTTNATKATVQALSHIVRIAYFGTVS